MMGNKQNIVYAQRKELALLTFFFSISAQGYQ